MKKYLKQLKENKKGFTLIEMIVVIGIIGILAAILVPSMAGYLKIAKESKNTANAKTVYTAAQAAVTSLEATNPVANTSADSPLKKTTANNASTDADKAVARKDLFHKIEDLIGTSNYNKIHDIEVSVTNSAVTSVKVIEKEGDAGITYS